MSKTARTHFLFSSERQYVMSYPRGLCSADALEYFSSLANTPNIGGNDFFPSRKVTMTQLHTEHGEEFSGYN